MTRQYNTQTFHNIIVSIKTNNKTNKQNKQKLRLHYLQLDRILDSTTASLETDFSSAKRFFLIISNPITPFLGEIPGLTKTYLSSVAIISQRFGFRLAAFLP